MYRSLPDFTDTNPDTTLANYARRGAIERFRTAAFFTIRRAGWRYTDTVTMATHIAAASASSSTMYDFYKTQTHKTESLSVL